MTAENNFCQFPWTWLSVNLESDLWRWCCKVPFTPGFQEHYPITKRLTEVKELLMENRKPTACKACWDDEDRGSTSYRKANNGTDASVLGLRYIDIVLSTTCNMKCATCGPGFSSQWQGILQINEKPKEFHWLNSDQRKAVVTEEKRQLALTKLLDTIKRHAKTIERIHVYGGEPSVDPTFATFVDQLLEIKFANKPAIRITSNGNFTDRYGEKFMEQLDRLRDAGWSIDIRLSVDAVGETAEFIRGGLKWSVFEKNIQLLHERGYCHEINVTVSTLSYASLPAIPAWLESIGLVDSIIPTFNLAVTPGWTSPGVLGHLASDLAPNWGKYKTHFQWHEFVIKVENLTRKQMNQEPVLNSLKTMNTFLTWYSDVTRKTVPADVARVRYLSDLATRHYG